jgi:putative membrane protein
MLKAVLIGAVALSLPVIASAAMPAPPTADYMMKAGQSDQFEIQTGRLAEQNGGSAMVKHMGAKMVTDHTKSTALIMAAAKKSHMPTPNSPPALDSDQQTMMANLQGKHGKDFDTAYVADQMTAHHKALDLQQSYAMGGADPHFKAAARKIVPVVKTHIAMLKKMGG